MTENSRGAASSGTGTLERTLGLKEAITIGAGIMIGAGIFVFPGLAGGRAGPAAMVSFGIAGLVALMVALPTAELATAMPRSGGGYHFVSRGFGAFFGSLAGTGQWLGLIFASAFYLAGFGYYASDLATRTGVADGLPVGWLSLVTGLLLTGLAIFGTREAGRLQDWIVGALLVLLVGFLSYGLLDAFGGLGARTLPGEFAPEGWLPVMRTAALVFTSYLGFQQIAVLSGEIRRPARTLPRALMGSVILVATLYILTMLVAASFATPETLAARGETALAHVAETLLGGTGGLIISTAGLLATLSSANASILSSSRVIFAQSRDGLLPEGISTVNRRYRTPHIALLLTGIPIAALTVLGRIDILAEVASTLHLVMFGLVCFAMLHLRRSAPWWYQPSFRLPAGKLVAGTGGLASFGLIGFMSPTTLFVSAAVLVLGVAWFLGYVRGTRVPTPAEPRPLPVEDRVRFLLVTPVPDAPGLPDDLLEAFLGQAVTLVGLVEVPEQTSPDQVRDEIGEEARNALEELAGRLRDEEIEVDTELAFTADPIQTLDDKAAEHEAESILMLRPAAPIRQILVPVLEPGAIEGLARYTGWLTGYFDAEVEVLRPEEVQRRRVRDLFRQEDAPIARLHTFEGGADPADAILERAESHELVVVGESADAGSESVLGEVSRRVLLESAGPVMVVLLDRLLRKSPEDEAAGDPGSPEGP